MVSTALTRKVAKLAKQVAEQILAETGGDDEGQTAEEQLEEIRSILG